MNTRTSVNIARTLVRLNNINRDIGSRGMYLLTVAGDDVIGDGHAGGGGAWSSLSGGGRARSS